MSPGKLGVALALLTSLAACGGARVPFANKELSVDEWKTLDAITYRAPAGFRDESYQQFAEEKGPGRLLTLQRATVGSRYLAETGDGAAAPALLLPSSCDMGAEQDRRAQPNAVITRRRLGDHDVLVCQTDKLSYTTLRRAWSVAIALDHDQVAIVRIDAPREDTTALPILEEIVASATPAHAPWSRPAPAGYVRRTMTGLDASWPSWVTFASSFRLVGPAGAQVEMFLTRSMGRDVDSPARRDLTPEQLGAYFDEKMELSLKLKRGFDTRVDTQPRASVTVDGYQGRYQSLHVAQPSQAPTVEHWALVAFKSWDVLITARGPDSEARALQEAWDAFLASLRFGGASSGA